MRRVLLAMVLLVGSTGSSKAAPPAPTTQIESMGTPKRSGLPQLLARGVTGVSVREVAMQPIELPADITGRAPG